MFRFLPENLFDSWDNEFLPKFVTFSAAWTPLLEAKLVKAGDEEAKITTKTYNNSANLHDFCLSFNGNCNNSIGVTAADKDDER